MERYIDKFSEWNQPETTNVSIDYLQSLEENVEYYKTSIDMIKDELYGVEGLTKDFEETFNSIKEIINDLEKELN